jgi:hypothetical protein
MRHEIPWAAAIAVVAVGLQGCAFTPATLDLKPTPEARIAGPLGDVEPVRFAAPDLTDARPDKARIGWKKNGYGQNTADITTSQPVDTIVEAAVAKALSGANHLVGGDAAVQVIGTVDRMWFDLDVNFWTVSFIGDVQCTLDFVDTATRQSIYKSNYSGTHREVKAGGLEATWTVVMNRALDKLIESIVLDEALADALKSVGSPTLSRTDPN